MTDLNFPFSDHLLDFPFSDDDDLLQTPTTTFPEVDAAVLDWLSISTTPTSILDPPWTSYPVKIRTKGKTRKRREFHPIRVLRRSCVHCETEETPQWRTGPAGPKTLCNACGVRFKSGRLFPEYRPAKSPGFREEVHSNSHKVVTERRRRGGVETVLSRVPARRAGGV